MELHFTKMHGLANDFIILNALKQPMQLDKKQISALAHRHTGIGFDQLLILEPSTQADFFCRIYNADGSEAQQCGNGLRCLARFIHEHHLSSQATFKIETLSGIYPVTVFDPDHICVAMGAPHISHRLIELMLDNEMWPATLLSMGNMHIILQVKTLDTLDINQLGSRISAHSPLTENANVGFMQILSPEHIRLRTFERGAGETQACGSNACAAVVAGIANGWLTNNVEVTFRYGSLHIEWHKQHDTVQMTGPAAYTFTGCLTL